MPGMRNGISPRSFLKTILFWTLFAGLCPGQSFLFVSPNTREHMSDESAAESLSSFEQRNFLAVADYLATRICGKAHVWGAEGIYAGNAENSSLVTGCASGQAAYLGELLGRYAHQKSILIFDLSDKGDEHLFVISISNGHPAEIVQELRRSGINGAAIVNHDQLVRVYIWLTDSSQNSTVHAFADLEHGTLKDIPGKGMLIGNDDRSAAQKLFDQRIRTYERSHHRSLSKRLWSKQLHDLDMASVH